LHRARLHEFRKGLFTGLPAMIGLLHLLLFAFYPKARQNFYYAIVNASFAWLNYVVWDSQFATAPEDGLPLILVIKLLTVLCTIASLRFVYSLFYDKVPRQFWVIMVVGIILMATSRVSHIAWVNVFALAALAELLRVVVVAVVRKRPGAWIVGIGSGVFVACIGLQMLEGIGVLSSYVEAVYSYGVLALLISMSIYLARQFAGVSWKLEAQLAHVRALSEDLKAANEQLTEYSRTLEEKVELRTREVSQKNAELQKLLEELRGAQEQLIMQEKMASLGTLVAGVAHEINNPIGAVHSAADVNARCLDRIESVAKDYRADFGNAVELLRENTRITKEASSRIAGIVKSLKSFARLDEATFQLADVDELIDTTVTLLRHEFGAHVLVDRIYGDLPSIGCYPNELNQAFMNVILNAIQSIDGDGTVRIVTTTVDGKVLVEIADTGRGMSNADRNRVFDPGFTRKGVGVGTGLGMSTVYRIVENHRGAVAVESELGKGTTVSITLPSDLIKQQ
jgi:signal transduction histidine kinase